MLEELKLPQQIEVTDWIEVGGTLYAVSCAPEANEYDGWVLHLTHDPRKDADIVLVVQRTVKLTTYKVL